MSAIGATLDVASRDLFIKGMRQVANSVAVVTTSGEAGRHGATVSAFSSVSADPPQVLVCLRSASRIATAVNANNAFCLNVLSHQHPHLAERFSGSHDSVVDDRFHGVDLHEEYGWVVLSEATAFCCTISDRVASGTHTIFIGHVQRLRTSSDEPLTYLQGRFRKLEQD
jgi:flavin reductase